MLLRINITINVTMYYFCCAVRKYQGWGASWTDVSEQGTCMACGQKLEKVGLRGEDRMKVRSSIVQIAARNGAAEVSESPK